MFIETERTPNPETLKFIPDREVLTTGTAFYPDRDSATGSPLAQTLFDVERVSAVFLGADFISVTKETGDWNELRTLVLGAIMEHFMSGRPVVETDTDSDPALAIDDADSDPDTVRQIRAIIDEKVRPAVANDGGDVVYQGFREGVVYLHMQGACAGCPSSTMTLKHGIENLLRHFVPEVQEVRQV